MYRTALQSSARALRTASRTNLVSASRRFASTTAAPRRGTWKGAAARWGLAFGAVYWYNTSPLFADEPEVLTRVAPPHFSEADNQTVDALMEEKRQKVVKSAPPPPPPTETKASEAAPAASDETAEAAQALEEEASQQGAFNPETGEINWDCPCLGGMAHGPCGEEFKAAFSCFVYSNEEPKGMECIDKFQHMQDCFRQYPEIYAAELSDDETDAPSPDGEAAAPAEAAKTTPEPPTESSLVSPAAEPTSSEFGLKQQSKEDPEETDASVRVHDATDANKDVKP